jgi:hypothetical protein
MLQCLGFYCVFLSHFLSCRSWIGFQWHHEVREGTCTQGETGCVWEAPLFIRPVCLKVFFWRLFCKHLLLLLISYIWSLTVSVYRLERRAKAQEAFKYNPRLPSVWPYRTASPNGCWVPRTQRDECIVSCKWLDSLAWNVFGTKQVHKGG